MALEIKDSNFEELLASGKPVVVDFWATWCGPCKKIAPDVEALAEEYKDQVIIGKCDVDDNDELTGKFGVRNIPTVLFIKDGEVKDKTVGAVTKARRDRMNALELDRIHMTSSNGTDLTVGLADDATWEGASSKTEDGIEFIANVPTEEVFCAPHRERTNGIVYGTKPYAYNGQLIEGWHVTFKDGVVVEHGAEKNADLLAELLSTDENSNRIGEIALVPASSPINRSGVLFYNTLFDENAACHIAFGAGYPTNIRGGSAMTRDDLMKKGLNNSAIHEDVMVGAADTHVTGITKRGEEVTIFENGEWAF